MTYVMSDIHGNMERLNSVLEQIALTKEDTLYVLGDMIDRFPDGIRIIRKLRSMSNVKLLIGNHELMMLEALYYPADSDYERECRLEYWYMNGGEVTHSHIKRIKKADRESLFEYLDSLPLNYELTLEGKDFILTHSGIEANFGTDPASYRYPDAMSYCVWVRNAGIVSVPDGKCFVFGHTPTCRFQEDFPMSIWRRDEHKIGIDCGCGYDYPGRLGCIRLEDMTEFYSADAAE